MEMGKVMEEDMPFCLKGTRMLLYRMNAKNPLASFVRITADLQEIQFGSQEIESEPNFDSLKLIFIYGLPASGKLTVAQELATMTGLKLFHNHVVVDLLLDVFEFGSPSFVELREKIWIDTFTQACRSQLPGLIFTFALGSAS